MELLFCCLQDDPQEVERRGEELDGDVQAIKTARVLINRDVPLMHISDFVLRFPRTKRQYYSKRSTGEGARIPGLKCGCISRFKRYGLSESQFPSCQVEALTTASSVQLRDKTYKRKCFANFKFPCPCKLLYLL